jgi:putative transposase
MPRLARAVVPGVPHHVTQRGNRRQQVFFESSDYQCYVQLLGDWSRKHGVEIWAYSLMPNHVHLIAVPSSEDALAPAIGEAHRRYTRMIHFRENWRGYLWQGRFASYPMDENYLLKAVRYVELNPVRAGLVSSAWDYRWSSARAHIRGENDELVSVGPMLERVGDWREYLMSPVSEADVAAMRRHTRTGRPLGSESFVDRLQAQLGRILRPLKPWTRKQTSPARR